MGYADGGQKIEEGCGRDNTPILGGFEGMKAGLRCPYCDYRPSMSMRADVNLYQHLRDKHKLSDREIREILRDFYRRREELSKVSFKCPRCDGRNLHLKVKCTITADIEGEMVKSWRISRVFYSTLNCRDCEAVGRESSFFYDFDELPGDIKSGIFNMK